MQQKQDMATADHTREVLSSIGDHSFTQPVDGSTCADYSIGSSVGGSSKLPVRKQNNSAMWGTLSTGINAPAFRVEGWSAR